MGMGEIDLSEMYTVRMTYTDKARNYILRQGETIFSDGGLAHDVLRSVDQFGLITQEAYSGLPVGDTSYNHNELHRVLKGFLDVVLKSRNPGKRWKEAFGKILDAYIGQVPESFTWSRKSWDPKSFASELGIRMEDYISITSFSHHPFNQNFILEIPDNYSNGSFLNLELNEMMEVVDHALENGFTISWDGDSGEKGFNQGKGLALLPLPGEVDSLFHTGVKEITVTQENRQENFESFQTTDDHLMHLLGRAVDQDGKVFYIIKNSWGKKGPYEGYLYMSEAYFRMKTISVTLHK